MLMQRIFFCLKLSEVTSRDPTPFFKTYLNQNVIFQNIAYLRLFIAVL
ncbi:hypothetical protein DFQ50_11380 [Pseudocitrobacter faecalis]|uniref:PheST operon leader peptide PheM n=1 Tax=Pseudocitrobacter faecalis TaxID=1398493 RepID=A0ABX9FPD7_9ENTR|nr:hypothetical protein DFQ50_11380 [Pseudocitrobacter faecalis]